MRRWSRRLFLSTVCGGALALAGCSLNSLYFLMPEDLADPEMGCSLVNPDKKKTNKVAILTYCPLEVRTDFLEADRLLCEMLVRDLRKHWEEYEEKVTIVSPRRMEMWKSSNPDWHTEDLTRIARALKVDFLIYLEVASFSLYEKNAYSSCYKGRMHIKATLVDPRQDDLRDHEMDLAYPSEAQPIPRDIDTPPAQFQRQFMEYTARRLSHLFVPHHKRDRAYIGYDRDNGFGE